MVGSFETYNSIKATLKCKQRPLSTWKTGFQKLVYSFNNVTLTYFNGVAYLNFK